MNNHPSTYSKSDNRGGMDWQSGARKARNDIFFAVIIAIAVFVLVAVFLFSESNKSELQKVFVVKQDINEQRELTQEDYEVLSVPKYVIPDNAIRDSQQFAQRPLAKSMESKQILLESDFVEGVDPKSKSLTLSQGNMGVVLPAAWFAAPMPPLKKEDRVSVFSTIPGSLAEQGTYIILSGARVVDVSINKDNPTPKQIMLDITAEEAAILAQAKANGVSMLMAIHGISSEITEEEYE